MVAKVNSGNSIQRILNYNENKVKAGVAECIHENIFGRPVDALSFHDKLEGVMRYADRNMRATSKAVHISLNFHADDQLDNAKLIGIADTYMERIGFGHQPYLVYRHHDAAHPHIHIVSTNITKDGERIVMYNIGRNQSEKARKEIETEFSLTVATGRRTQPDQKVARAIYGKTETKKTIAVALRSGLQYKYTSLAEFNAVLKQFNVVADRGRENSFMHGKKGLLYCLTDRSGKKVGVPIKASLFHNKPTLKYLEKQFTLNEALRLPHKERLQRVIDDVFEKSLSSRNVKVFVKALNAQGVFVLFRRNDCGQVYGLTFVDNKTKCVFNGSDLGKKYSAKWILEQLPLKNDPDAVKEINFSQRALDWDLGLEKTMDDLLTAKQYGSDYLNPNLRRRRKRKRGRSI